MHFLAKLILKILGWKIDNSFPRGIDKSVIIMAPHTSNYDFIIGWLSLCYLKVKPSLIIKKEAFGFPAGIFLKAMGGIPVDRQNSANTLKSINKLYKEKDSMHLVVTPEGTRKLTNNWKKGFYFIAKKTDVPIILGYLDYKKKTGGVGPVINPSGDFEKDFECIANFYKDKTARHPEKFNLSK